VLPSGCLLWGGIPNLRPREGGEGLKNYFPLRGEKGGVGDLSFPSQDKKKWLEFSCLLQSGRKTRRRSNHIPTSKKKEECQSRLMRPEPSKKVIQRGQLLSLREDGEERKRRGRAR